MFNIFTQVKKEIENYTHDKVAIVSVPGQQSVRYLDGETSGFLFSQKDTLDKIDMYYNSQFLDGKTDENGMLKVFLNICKFRADVATKQVDIDVKDFVFIPEETSAEWAAHVTNRIFRNWTKETYFGELINDVLVDLPKYGSAVVKTVNGVVERVPLRNLMIEQDAPSIDRARYLIQVHESMTLHEMQGMKQWDTKGIKMEYGETMSVYERYGLVPRSLIEFYAGREERIDLDDTDLVEAVVILSFDGGDGGHVFFAEEVEKRPYEEAHWSRIDGRWLGVGEIENQFDNQIMRNTIANLRRRSMMWASKNVFVTSDEEAKRNLLTEVSDGDVIQMGVNGQITPVNIQTRSLGDYQSAAQEWEANSDQRSFTFEVATGESLPSGTPFRLGVVMSNTVNSHFKLKQENIGLFFRRLMREHVYPVFLKELKKERTLTYMANEDGASLIVEAFRSIAISDNIKKQMLSGIYPDLAEIKAKVEEELKNRRVFIAKISENYLNQVKMSVDLVITGESVDLPKKIETLTNFYNVLSSRQDPAADRVLQTILSLTGEYVGSSIAATPSQTAQTAPQAAFQVPEAIGQQNTGELAAL